ncbi:MAG: hypothetical protein Q7S82_02580 [bacterium]|nr:hypothetical protein [bacterium]
MPKPKKGTTLTTFNQLETAISSFPQAVAATDDEISKPGNGDDGRTNQAIDIPAPPELPAIENLDYEAEAAKMRSGRVTTARVVESCLGELDKLSHLTTEEARYLAAQKVAALTVALSGCLTHGFPPFRRAAWVALLRYEFSRSLSTKEEVERLLGKLISEERLAPCAVGVYVNRIEAYGMAYAVHSTSLCEEADIAEIKQALDGLLSRVYQEVGKARQAKAQDLARQATISMTEFLAGNPGRVYVVVPPVEETNSRDGQRFWRAGGGLLLESNGQDVAPLGASGGIELAIQEAMKLRVHLKVYTLDWDMAPKVPGLDLERGKKVQLLWYLIARAKEAVVKTAEAQVNRAQLSERATVSAEEWFLRREAGACSVNFPVWEVKDSEGNTTQRIRDLLLLLERQTDGTIAVRDIQSANPFNDIFASCMGEYVVTGERYEGVPYPLRAILQAGYGLTLRSVQDAKKAVQINRT